MRAISRVAKVMTRSTNAPRSFSALSRVASLASGATTCTKLISASSAVAAVVTTQRFCAAATDNNELTTTASGLKYLDYLVGEGTTPVVGQMVHVHYTGTLADGTKFDSSLDRGRPISFLIGRGKVIKGWDEGIMSMKVGGKRKLVIPPELGYGTGGVGPIPPNATLIFDCELVGVGKIEESGIIDRLLSFLK